MKNEKGSALISILIIMLVVSLLGMALLNLTTANLKQTRVESEYQAVYYIAEAGVNQIIHSISKKVDELSHEKLSHEDFFAELDNYIEQELKSKILNNFENSFGEEPHATVTIDTKTTPGKDENVSEDSREVKIYTIKSKGEIGKLNRAVSTSIKVAHGIKKEAPSTRHPAFDYVMYSGGENKTLAIPSGSNIDGPVYGYDINFNASRTKINGSIISESAVILNSGTEVEGNIYAMDGTVKISSSNTKICGDIHASDDVILESGTIVDGSIFTNGSVILKSSNVKITGDIHAAGNVTLGSGATVKNIYTNGEIIMSSNNTIDGKQHSLGDVIFGSNANVKDIYTQGNVEFSSGNTVNGDINAMGYVGSDKMGNDVKIAGSIFSGSNVITRNWQGYEITGNVHAAGDVRNGNNNIISGNVVSAKKIFNLGVIKGDTIEDGNPTQPQVPIALQEPDFVGYKIIGKPELSNKLLEYQPSSEKMIISTNTLSLEPGNYGVIEFSANQGGTIMLESGGDYFFNSITGGNQNKTLRLDFSKGGNINIYIKNNLKWNGTIEISTNGKDWANLTELSKEEQIKFAERIYWETHGATEIHQGGDKHWLGTLLSQGNIIGASGSYIVGALVTHSQIVYNGNNDWKIIYASGNLGNGGSSSSNDENGEGENTILPKYRIKTTSPVREDK